jgi:hypothetical protein
LQRVLKFVAAAVGLVLVVGTLGTMIAGPDSRQAVWVGVGLALLIQIVLLLTLFVWAFAERPMLAHGVGMLGRLFAVGCLALFWAPSAVLPAAPLLFSLVAALFLTTLLEPLFLVSNQTGR